jgi:hypothetical protein
LWRTKNSVTKKFDNSYNLEVVKWFQILMKMKHCYY